jgi:atypical dual specificity phosphatase
MIHCAAGRGRTGTVLAAYILREENLTADDAIKQIRSIRPGSIQSDQQEIALVMYEKYVRSKKK